LGRVILFAVLLLSGCAGSLDSEQLRLCRLVLPALHPDGTTLREVRAVPAALGKRGVRIDYLAREPGDATMRRHFLACGFAGTTFDRDRLDREAVETDAGLFGDARLLYLKRFWLPFAESEAPPAAANVPDVPANVAYALQQLLSAAVLAAVYALLATAYSLI